MNEFHSTAALFNKGGLFSTAIVITKLIAAGIVFVILSSNVLNILSNTFQKPFPE